MYGKAVRAKSKAMTYYLAQPYGFATFADGSPILPSHRRLFRIWRERHGNAIDPFATGENTFHAALKMRKLLAKSSADLIADKATSRSVAKPSQLLKVVRLSFYLIFRLIGRSRFFFLVRGLKLFSHPEQHYETFSLDDSTIAQSTERSPQ